MIECGGHGAFIWPAWPRRDKPGAQTITSRRTKAHPVNTERHNLVRSTAQPRISPTERISVAAGQKVDLKTPVREFGLLLIIFEHRIPGTITHIGAIDPFVGR
jgi:hypothetical protein